MGLFSELFGKRKEASEEPQTKVNLPYETVIVGGEEAVDTCLRLRQEGAGQFTPVILGNPNDLSILLDGFETNRVPPQEIANLAKGITMPAFVAKRMAAEEEYYGDVEVGEWPTNVAPSENLTGHTYILRGRPLKNVAICRVPTPHSWEVPAYLAFGGWNECPAPEEHVALLQYWNEKYGADIITLGNDVIECTVTRPPTDKKQALELAREQFVYCPDNVDQGTETLSGLAAVLQGGKTWFFWWD